MDSTRDPRIEHARQAIRRALFGGDAVIGSPGPVDADAARIGRFELIDKLGEGGMGVVYSARDPSLDRKVAIKLLRHVHAAAHGGEERLQREAHALAKLSHPNVVVIHEVGLHAGQVYLVMEFVDGETIGAWCRRHADDWRGIVAKYVDAGRGLAVAHAAGFVHRDFKPDNVLVGHDGRVRVLDFGLAATGTTAAALDATLDADPVAGDLTATGTILGTPAYMAPEQHDGTEVDARADQFAFCVSLWEGLFGERPFGGADLPSLRTALMIEERRAPPRDTAVPRAIVAVVERGLSIDCAGRYPDMTALLDALGAAVREPASRPRRRGIVPIAIGVAAVVGVAAWTQWRPQAEEQTATIDANDAPALEPIDAPAVPVEIRRLTQTSGRGAEMVDIDEASGRLLYRHGDFWLRPLDGGVPSELQLPIEGYDYVLLADDEGLLVFRDERLSRVDAAGGVHEVDATLPEEPSVVRLSPDGRRLLAATSSSVFTWDLATPGPAVQTEFHVARVSSAAWSPDGNALALVSDGPARSSELRIFDREGTKLASTPLMAEWPSVAWLADGALVVLEHDEGEFWLRCHHVVDDEIVRGRRSSSLGRYSRFHRLIEADPAGLLLMTLTEVQNDVAIVDASDTSKATVLSPDWDSDDIDPVWLADGGLAVATGRFLKRTLVRAGDDFVSVTPMTEDAIAWAESDGAGGLVYATDADPSVLRRLAAGATDAVDVPGVELLAGADAARVACLAPDDCLMTQPSDGTPVFFALDLTTGRTERRFECPRAWSCGGRRRWTYAHGPRLLMIDEAQRRFAELDPITGTLLRIHPEPSAEQIIQSVRQARGDEGYWLTGMESSAGESDPYLIYRYEPDVGYRVVYRGDANWVFGAEPSPDGQRLALDMLTFHGEAWTADVRGLCIDRSKEAQSRQGGESPAEAGAGER